MLDQEISTKRRIWLKEKKRKEKKHTFATVIHLKNDSEIPLRATYPAEE